MAHPRMLEAMKAAEAQGVEVVCFTSTRWNTLQTGTAEWSALGHSPPTTANCISFALYQPSVTSVTHSARSLEELQQAVANLHQMSDAEEELWRQYGLLVHDETANFEVLYP
eukprot:scaffold7539_cov390-Prasinococcus_capsulatus_cf.AAC.1